jgi:hypothetical protein
MRPVICALLALVASTSTASAAGPVTLILQFDGRHSELSVSEMKRELQNLLRDSGTELSWRNSAELSPAESFPSVVVVTFHGSCEMRPFQPLQPNDGAPLGFSHISNGEIIPFADVECDRIRSELRSGHGAIGPGDDRMLGRALGRVLAHELHHIIDRSRTHERTGLLRKSLSPQDLIADRTLSSPFTH